MSERRQACCRCSEEHPLSADFFYANANTRFGFDTRCKRCAKAAAAKRYEAKAKEISAQTKNRLRTDADFRARQREIDHRKYLKRRDAALAAQKARKLLLRQDPDYVKAQRQKKNARFTVSYADPEKRAEFSAQRRRFIARHPDYQKEYLRRPEVKKRMRAAWLENYKRPKTRARYIAKAQARHAQQLRATPPWVNLDDLTPFYELAVYLEENTGIKHHVDHIIPLRGKDVCGLHVAWNLQVIPAEANMAKGNKIDPAAVPLDFLWAADQLSSAIAPGKEAIAASV